MLSCSPTQMLRTPVALMVALDSLPGSRAWTRSADVRRCRFTLGGVALELLPEPGFDWEVLPADTCALMQTCSTAPTLAAAACSVRIDPGLAPKGSAVPRGRVQWEPTPDGVRVRASQVVLDIAALGQQRYVVAARIGTKHLFTRMLNTLVATLAELAGGLCLHATAVELRGRAVLLLGPSGAGKTTAAELLAEASGASLGDVTCLSNDRVAVVPDPPSQHAARNRSSDMSERTSSSGYWVWSLPIGTPPALPRCAEVALPLAASLFVVQAPESVVVASREVEAMLHLRQAVEVGIGTAFLEPQRLAAIAALASASLSGVARVALAGGWRSQLEAFLAQPVASASGASVQRLAGDAP